MHSISNLNPIDEVTCYTKKSLQWLVYISMAILTTDVICAFTALVITSTSLPPTIRFLFSTTLWLFGFNSSSEEEEEDQIADEADDGDSDTETEVLHV